MTHTSYLSIDQVAKRFGVNVTTVYRLVQRGEIPGFKIGNQWRFSVELLDSWVTDKVTVKWLMTEEDISVNRIADAPKIQKTSKNKSQSMK